MSALKKWIALFLWKRYNSAPLVIPSRESIQVLAFFSTRLCSTLAGVGNESLLLPSVLWTASSLRLLFGSASSLSITLLHNVSGRYEAMRYEKESVLERAIDVTNESGRTSTSQDSHDPGADKMRVTRRCTCTKVNIPACCCGGQWLKEWCKSIISCKAGIQSTTVESLELSNNGGMQWSCWITFSCRKERKGDAGVEGGGKGRHQRGSIRSILKSCLDHDVVWKTRHTLCSHAASHWLKMLHHHH